MVYKITVKLQYHCNYLFTNSVGRYRGFKGEVGIEVPEFTGIADEFIRANHEIGLPSIDINTPHDLGVFKLEHATLNGVRNAPYNALLKPIRRRKTLTIRKYSQVNKVNMLQYQTIHTKNVYC